MENAVSADCPVTLASLEEAGLLNGTTASVRSLRKDGVSLHTLHKLGTDSSLLAAAGYPLDDFRMAGVPLAELKGLRIVDVPTAVTTFEDLRQIGYSLHDLQRAGASFQDLIAQNCTPAGQQGKPRWLVESPQSQDKCTPASLRRHGFSIIDLYGMGAGTGSLLSAGFSVSDFERANVSLLGFRDVRMAELRENGWSPLELRQRGASPQDLLAAGAETGELKQANYSIAELTYGNSFGLGLSIKDLREIGANVSDLRAAGFSYADLYFGGVPHEDLHRYPFATVTKAPGAPSWPWQVMASDTDTSTTPDVPRFPGSFPDVKSLPGVWLDAITKARGDPCDDGVLHPHFVLTHEHSGLCSRLNNFVNELLVAMYSRRPFAPCENPDMKNLWAENFDTPDMMPVCRSCKIRQYDNSEEWLWAKGFRVARDHRTADMEFTKRFLYKKLFVPKRQHLEAADALQRTLGLIDVPYVGVHIRREDKVLETHFSRTTEDFADNAWRLCKGIGCRKIFIGSDSAQERPRLAELIARYNASIQVVEQPRLAQETFKQRSNLSKDAGVALIVDMLLLIRATAFVGTASSNVDRFVWFQRDPGTQSVSLDDFGDFLRRSG
jgi:hypothetical protein